MIVTASFYTLNIRDNFIIAVEKLDHTLSFSFLKEFVVHNSNIICAKYIYYIKDLGDTCRQYAYIYTMFLHLEALITYLILISLYYITN